MISIVTAYYNRKLLFKRTLDSLRFYENKFEFEIIAVDDGSSNAERLEDLIVEYPYLRVHRILPEEKWYSNPCIPFNIGIALARGEKIILQNPECYHFNNILGYVASELKSNSYLSFGCFSLDKENTDDDVLFNDRSNINALINKSSHIVKSDGALGWYNHSKFRPASYHFCTAIMTADLVDLGGFDPRYAFGHGYDDDDLIYRIKLKGLKVKHVDNLIVLHQNHYFEQADVNGQKIKYLNDKALRNKHIYETITRRTRISRANFIKTIRFEQQNDVYIVTSSSAVVKRIIANILRFFSS